jgi:hypothetical protein
MFQKDTNVDTDMWPILIIRAGDTDDADIAERTLAVVEELYQTKKEPYVTVLDGRNGRRPSPDQRYLQVEFRRKHEDHVRQYSRGTAIVSKSEILKAVVAAMHWIKAPDTTTKMFTDMASAIAWAHTRLET